MYAVLAAAAVLLTLTGISGWLFDRHVEDLQLEALEGGAIPCENPCPVDRNGLEALGIEPFSSSLPVLMIDTGDQEIVREEKRRVQVAVYDSRNGDNHILDDPDLLLDAKMKIRGSERPEKQQYRLNLLKPNSSKELAYPLLGMGADSRWVLQAPYADRTLMRSFLMYRLSREIMDWAPDCRFFELFVNGNYEGVYLAVEPVGVSSHRLNLSRFSLLSGDSPYVLCREKTGEEVRPLTTYANRNGYTRRLLDLKYPDPARATKAQTDWIQRDISAFEEALYSDRFDDPETGYANYIDMDSFVDYLILNEFAMNRDAGELSTYVYKDMGGKLKLCVWDFNKSFDNYRGALPVDQWTASENTWFDRMLQDRNFAEKFQSRYAELRQGPLSEEALAHRILEARTMLGDAAKRNFIRWSDSFSSYYVYDEKDLKRNPENYFMAVKMLEKTIENRLAFLDEAVPQLTENCVN